MNYIIIIIIIVYKYMYSSFLEWKRGLNEGHGNNVLH